MRAVCVIMFFVEILIFVTMSNAVLDGNLLHSDSDSTADSHAGHIHCSAVNPDPAIFQQLVNHKPARKKRDVSTPQPIRITAVYDASVEALTNASALKTIVQQALVFLRSALLVRQPSTSPIYVYRSCGGNCFGNCPYNCNATVRCTDFKLSSNYLQPCTICDGSGQVTDTVGGPGVSGADYVLFVTSLFTSSCGSSTIAYAAFCNFDISVWRPNAGSLNFCSTNSRPMASYDPATTMRIVIHEITHALGFISSLFALYRDEYGNPRTPLTSTGFPPEDSNGNFIWSSNVTVTKSVDWLTANGVVQVNKTYMVTPTVVNFVRNFFNCSTLIGAELEDQGGSGTSISHWEKRIFVNEYMAGMISEDLYISGLTLSLLQDTGWYVANFSMAEPLTWGKGLGCGYATQSCLSWINTQTAAGASTFPFCGSFDQQLSCDTQQQAVRTCNIGYYASVPAAYSYFSQVLAGAPSSIAPSRYGSAISLADYCPYYGQIIRSYSTNSRQFSTCSNVYAAIPSYSNFAQESYGYNSLCLRQPKPTYMFQCNSRAVPSSWGSGCYSVTCTDSAVIISVSGQSYVCSSELQAITWGPTLSYLNVSVFPYTPTLASGTVLCPLCANACPNQACPMARTSSSLASTFATAQSGSSTAPTVVPSSPPCYAATSTSVAAPSTTCSTCSLNAQCVTTTSGYYCVCNSGYYGNGITCSLLNSLYYVSLQTNVSFPINVTGSDVLNQGSTSYMQVKQQLEASFDAALSLQLAYQPSSATVQQLYAGSLVAQVSAVYGSYFATRNTVAPSLLSTMNSFLTASVNNLGTNCSIGNFANVNCAAASVTSSNQNPCSSAVCPSGTSCSATSNYVYVCVCPPGLTLSASSLSTVQLEGCTFSNTAGPSKNGSVSIGRENLVILVLVALLFCFVSITYHQSGLSLFS